MEKPEFIGLLKAKGYGDVVEDKDGTVLVVNPRENVFRQVTELADKAGFRGRCGWSSEYGKIETV